MRVFPKKLEILDLYFFLSSLKTTVDMLYYTVPSIVKKDMKSPGLHMDGTYK